ncbi:adenylyl-sulfate kinase isoform X2 [Zea mays]|uniref:adenylyl-sulfate kinase isoform X2 n=1 Tax=Zea mays TaxID=4577 RepID=UPI0004DEC25F|nr:adenylyl-sulfate kinase isoform X2 [Zea mays]|eukprot:XP_008658403.1 adenylyl-sulfate kinase isoform X2 [Zea mays]
MASLPVPHTLPRVSPAIVGAARGRAAVRVRTATAALGGGCGGGGGMEQRHGDAPHSPVKEKPVMSNIGKSTNILWHNCLIGQSDRQKLLGQKGCVVWITGLSGSEFALFQELACWSKLTLPGDCLATINQRKSTLACALSRELHCRGHLTYVLDGDNLRHGLNRDLSFKAEDRAENIRRVGEVAKLFADAGVICIASLISPYRRDRDACRALLPHSNFIEVFIDLPLKICEARDPKGLYKLARTGKIKGFTGIDDPYEPPINDSN